MKTFFKVIIPNYNNASWLMQCLTSVFTQTFTDYKVIFIDDASTDNSVNIVKTNFIDEIKSERLVCIESSQKVWNGGARNIGLTYNCPSEYTLFLDSDDWFSSDKIFEQLYNTLCNNNFPDCLRLSYNCVINNDTFPIILSNQDTPEKLVSALEVACWTKCIKSNLVQKFPENTLMEDVVQHIKQCDVISSVVEVKVPCVSWNRNNTNSCSREENQNLQNGKWQSSMYRYAADLLDLNLIHDYCIAHRDWRFSVVNNNIKENKYIQ